MKKNEKKVLILQFLARTHSVKVDIEGKEAKLLPLYQC